MLVAEEELEKCIDEAVEYRRSAKQTWLKACEKLQKLVKANQNEVASAHSSSSNKPEVKGTANMQQKATAL